MGQQDSMRTTQRAVILATIGTALLAPMAALLRERTGRMAMRRGHHTSLVLKALGTPNGDVPSTLSRSEIIPNAFSDVH